MIFCGCVLWDLSHSSVENVCIVWRKGLRRIWDLPSRAHSNLLAPASGLLPLNEEHICRCASFIVRSLDSVNSVVEFVFRNGVCFRRMLSRIGRNAFYCLSLRWSNLNCINKRFAWHFVEQHIIHHTLDERSFFIKILYVKFRYLQLPLLNLEKVSIILNHV